MGSKAVTLTFTASVSHQIAIQVPRPAAARAPSLTATTAPSGGVKLSGSAQPTTAPRSGPAMSAPIRKILVRSECACASLSIPPHP